jgi:hypothetical protein
LAALLALAAAPLHVPGPVVGTSGQCSWGGDDFQSDASWDTSDCNISSFTGQTFDTALDEGSYDVFIDPDEYQLVYFIHESRYVYNGGAHDTYYTLAHAGSVPSFSGRAVSGALVSSADAVFFVGFVGGCPKNTYDDAGCAAWAYANNNSHNEPMLCIENPASDLGFAICEFVITEGLTGNEEL